MAARALDFTGQAHADVVERCGETLAESAARLYYGSAMRTLLLTLLIAATLSSCGDIVVGPVDHSCHSNPGRGTLGSGCGGGGGGR